MIFSFAKILQQDNVENLIENRTESCLVFLRSDQLVSEFYQDFSRVLYLLFMF